MAKCPFCAIPLADLDAPFARFTPAALKTIFDSDSEGGGYQNFTVTPRGGMRFFTGTFPRKNKKF